MTQTAQHTATPWRVGELCNGNIEIIHDNMNPKAITRALARVTARPTWLSEAEANAAFIVQACNSHDALVAALQELLNYAEGMHKIAMDEEGEEVDYVTFPNARAALTAAGAA